MAISCGLRHLAVVFAAVALLLALHQTSVVGQFSRIAAVSNQVEEHYGDCAGDHPMHSTSCCSTSVGLATPPSSAALNICNHPVHVAVGRFDPMTFNVRSKLYRPPRLV